MTAAATDDEHNKVVRAWSLTENKADENKADDVNHTNANLLL